LLPASTNDRVSALSWRELSDSWRFIFIVGSNISTRTRASDVWRYQSTLILTTMHLRTFRDSTEPTDCCFRRYWLATTLKVKRWVMSAECR
jgi:hypothetical protein